MIFNDRIDAGKKLAEKLKSFTKKKDVVILGVTRGGVIVAQAIAQKLNLPLDIVVIKKMGLPEDPELAIGAIGPKGITYWYQDLIKKLNVSRLEMGIIKKVKQREQEKLEAILRKKKPALNLKNKTVIVVDDGIATGASVICASEFLKKEKVDKRILATPMITQDTLRYVSKHFDNVVSLTIPEGFSSVGQFYENFPQIEDEDVRESI